MPRQARQLSTTGIYHIMLRGINRQRIFEDVVDYSYFLESLRHVQKDSGINILAYCCMTNHVHLLLEEGDESISVTMKRLGIRYASWFNRRYDRVGHLFQDRFASRPVTDDAYFQTVLMYIHFNPVVGGLCEGPLEYRWSSRPTLGRPSSLVNLSRLEELMPMDALIHNEAMYEPTEVPGEPALGSSRLTDDQAWTVLSHISGASNSADFQRLSRSVQQGAIRCLQFRHVSIRQISRLTGLNRNLIYRWSS